MDKEKLIEHIEDGKSTYDIAKIMGCGQTSIRYWLRKYGLNTKNTPIKNDNGRNGKNCVYCGSDLSGNRIKFCGSKCKSIYHYTHTSDEINGNTNERQKRISKERKLKLIEMKGGGCQSCGYNKNMAALSFHHRNPENKTYCIDSRRLSNTTWESILIEAEKCDLLCLNCHAEHHNPNMELKIIRAVGLEPTTVQDGFDRL